MKPDKDDISAIAEAVVERITKKRFGAFQSLATPLRIILWLAIPLGIIMWFVTIISLIKYILQ